MQQFIAQITLTVNDYDEAIAFYTQKLGFVLLENTPLSPTKRWMRVAPAGNNSCCLLLAKAVGEQQLKSVGNQTGGRVFLFLHTTNFDVYYQQLCQHQVTIVRPPTIAPYGKVAVFADLYGNLWDLIEPSKN
ncbi:MAG: VOC family protein [Chitinophagaceae bacterium]